MALRADLWHARNLWIAMNLDLRLLGGLGNEETAWINKKQQSLLAVPVFLGLI